MLKGKLLPCLALILLAASAGADTTLHDAVRDGDIERVRELLAAGADVNTPDDSGYTPLHTAVRSSKHEAMVPLLIEAGADLNARSGYLGTPLHMAVLLMNSMQPGLRERPVRLLIEAGADLNAINSRGLTPLLYARADALRLLIEAGADVNAKLPGKSNGTVLHFYVGGRPITLPRRCEC